MSRKRQPETEPAPPERLAEAEGPSAIGCVIWHDPEHNGYRRRAVRIPLELLDELASGPVSAPDHRSTHVVWMQKELMSDEALNALHREKP